MTQFASSDLANLPANGKTEFHRARSAQRDSVQEKAMHKCSCVVKASVFISMCSVSAVIAALMAHAGFIAVEPDDFQEGQALTNVVNGVTLSVSDGSGVTQNNDQVEAFRGDLIRTDAPAAADAGALLAYDASDTLLGVAVASLGAAGTFSTATFSRGTTDIAYVLAGGYPIVSGPPYNIVALENLRFSVDPLPTVQAGDYFPLQSGDQWIPGKRQPQRDLHRECAGRYFCN